MARKISRVAASSVGNEPLVFSVFRRTRFSDFHGVYGVDDLPDRCAEGKERGNFGPGPAPGRGDGRVFAALFFFEAVQLACCFRGGRRLINGTQVSG